VAQAAFASMVWPQPYLCTTLVHMLARLGEGLGAVARRGARLVWLRGRVSGESQEGKAGWEARRADWQERGELLLVADSSCGSYETAAVRSSGGRGAES
jgi:hypothetical protein